MFAPKSLIGSMAAPLLAGGESGPVPVHLPKQKVARRIGCFADFSLLPADELVSEIINQWKGGAVMRWYDQGIFLGSC